MFLIQGCQNQSPYSFIFESENKTFSIEKISFYKTTNNGEVYLYIEAEKDRNRFFEEPLLSVKFQTQDSIYTGKLIKVFFSREKVRTPFIIEVDNLTKKAIPIVINQKQMLFIGMDSDLSQSLLKSIEENILEIE